MPASAPLLHLLFGGGGMILGAAHVFDTVVGIAFSFGLLNAIGS